VHFGADNCGTLGSIVSYRVTARADHQDLASGWVLRSAPGFPAFPVRLGQELFLRAFSHLPAGQPVSLWDPCCGSGYLATVLGLLHRDKVRRVCCSDIAPEAVALAGGNLALLTRDGLAQRATELRALAAAHGKPGRAEAAEAAARLAERLREGGGDLPATAWVADAFDPAALAAGLPTPGPDLVVTDVPYGRQTSWLGRLPPGTPPLVALTRALCAVLPDHAVLALCAQTRKIDVGTGARALERFRTGTRAAFIGRVEQLRSVL
jgi:hypothetical protein